MEHVDQRAVDDLGTDAAVDVDVEVVPRFGVAVHQRLRRDLPEGGV